MQGLALLAQADQSADSVQGVEEEVRAHLGAERIQAGQCQLLLDLRRGMLSAPVLVQVGQKMVGQRDAPVDRRLGAEVVVVVEDQVIQSL